MLTKGNRVRAKRPMFFGGIPLGTLGTFKGGADYVPGLDAGHYSVMLDEPDGVFGHRCVSHWTLDEVLESWEPVA